MCDYYFSIRLFIKHRSIPLSDITNVLGINPNQGWSVGDANKKGVPHKETYWNYSFDVENERFFLNYAANFLQKISADPKVFIFLRNLEKNGGSAFLVIQLLGDLNIGDSISVDNLKIFSDTGVELGIEYFNG